jgi:hypothetical protein
LADCRSRKPYRYGKWWATAVMIGSLALVIPSVAGCGGESKPSPSASLTPSTSIAVTHAAAPPATPKYKISWVTTRKNSDREHYYLVIDPVDLSNDGFKQNVKLILQDVAKTHGSPEFTADVYDDSAVADYDHRTDIDNPNAVPDPDTSSDHVKATAAADAQHDVAQYDSGASAVSVTGFAYEITWYPSASGDSPNVGKYADGVEQWKP